MQKTAYEMRISDWSSDVCSSDLQDLVEHLQERGHPFARIADRKTFIDRSTTEMTVRLTVDAGRPATSGPLALAGRQAVAEAYLRRHAHRTEGATQRRRMVREQQRGKASAGEEVCEYGDLSVVAPRLKQ